MACLRALHLILRLRLRILRLRLRVRLRLRRRRRLRHLLPLPQLLRHSFSKRSQAKGFRRCGRADSRFQKWRPAAS